MDAARKPVSDGESAEVSLRQAVLALRGLMFAGEEFRQSVAGHFGVGLSETIAMSHLGVSGSLTPGQVAEKVGLTRSTITSLLDRLESAGLAVRTPHPSDRRKSVVVITESGVAMLVQVQRWMRSAFGVLDPAYLPDAVVTLTELSNALTVQAARIRDQPAADSS